MQFSMKTISYFQLCFSLPAWRGWLKSLWHVLFLVHSQAQTVSGKTILAKLRVRMFIRILFCYFPLHLCAHVSAFPIPPLYFTFSTIGAVRCTRPFKMTGTLVSLLELRPLAGARLRFRGQHKQSCFPFRLVVPLHGHLYLQSTSRLFPTCKNKRPS